MSTTPLVRDEQIYKRVDEYTLPYRTEITRVTKEFRDIYEAELQSMRERLSRMEETLSDDEATKLIWDRFPRHDQHGEKTVALQFMDFRHGASEIIKVLRNNGYLSQSASTEPRLTVEQAMEVVEPFIDAEAEMEDGARWNWESKHKKYREMIEEIRDRFTKAAKP